MSTLKRMTHVHPGHDCIRHPCGKNGCGTRPGSGHGIATDEWQYAIGDGTVALAITVASTTFPESVPKETREEYHARGTHCYGLAIHATFPRTTPQVLDGPSHPACAWIGEQPCYSRQATGILFADEWWKTHGGPEGPERPEAFWIAFEALYRKLTEGIHLENMTTHERCPMCRGEGAAPKPISDTEAWALCNAATRGPWRWDLELNEMVGPAESDDRGRRKRPIIESDAGCYGPDLADAKFIEAARTLVPALLKRIADKEEALALAERALTQADLRILATHRGMADHSCGQCRPGGPIVGPAFTCAYHQALTRQEGVRVRFIEEGPTDFDYNEYSPRLKGAEAEAARTDPLKPEGACCNNERRGMNGGCGNCGAPCL